MINAIHHVAVSTASLDRLAAFYSEGFGFVEEGRVDWEAGEEAINNIMGLPESAARTVMLRLGDMRLELFQFEQPVPPVVDNLRPVHHHGITHFCFDVTDIDKVCERLQALGASFHCVPQDFGDSKTTYGRDPDGNVFELTEFLD
ncbi:MULTISPECIES: VOC family protein [Pseudomonas]|uniref:VOC family protein n=1 Tax=Pseudomonas TaxID=286 RepID=UPI001239C7D6|nr:MULTISPECIES: VOC family protein [Pseudomonas]QIB51202.1 VOC family protein [Pseudomonas sp. OIL-1]